MERQVRGWFAMFFNGFEMVFYGFQWFSMERQVRGWFALFFNGEKGRKIEDGIIAEGVFVVCWHNRQRACCVSSESDILTKDTI